MPTSIRNAIRAIYKVPKITAGPYMYSHIYIYLIIDY